MANPEKTKFSVLREGTQFGDAASVEMTEREAEAFIRAGDIGPFDPSLKIFKSKTAARGRASKSNAEDAALIKQLQAELAQAVAAQEASAAALKASDESKAAIEAEMKNAQDSIAEYRSENAGLNERLTEAEKQYDACVANLSEAQDLLNEAVAETESLERVILLIEEAQPELVAQVKETVAAEYQAAADAAAQQG